MEPPVIAIRYPELRAMVVDAVRSLSDPELQRQVWIGSQAPPGGGVDDFTTNVHVLFDDALVLPEPAGRVGSTLYPDEVAVLRELGQVLELLLDELGDVGDADYLAHPRWPEVVRRAADAYELLHSNDTGTAPDPR